MPGQLWIGILLPAAALLLAGGAGLLPARRRVLGLLAFIALMAAVCGALFVPANPWAMLLLLPCMLNMLLFLPAMARPVHEEWPVTLLGAGIALHIVAQFIKHNALFQSVAALLPWIFAAYLIGCLFSVNRSLLMSNSPTAFQPLLKQNRLLLSALCVAAVLLANLRSVAAAIRTAITWAVTAVAAAVVWLLSLFYVENETAGPPESAHAFEGLGEAAEPSLLSQILEIVFMVVAGLLAAVLLYFAAKQLRKLLRKLFRAILERLQAYRQKIAADYVDTSESLLHWDDLRQTAKARVGKIKRRYLPTPWEKLTPAERVRRVYALLLRRQRAQTDPAQTARETLQSGALRLPGADAEALAALYDQARYSDHPIADADADSLRKRTKV